MYRIFLSKVWYTELVNYTNKGNNEEDCKKTIVVPVKIIYM